MPTPQILWAVQDRKTGEIDLADRIKPRVERYVVGTKPYYRFGMSCVVYPLSAYRLVRVKASVIKK